MKNVSEYISTWDVFYGGNAAEQRTMTTTRHKQHKSGKLYPCQDKIRLVISYYVREILYFDKKW